jgi:hypothetical protein
LHKCNIELCKQSFSPKNQKQNGHPISDEGEEAYFRDSAAIQNHSREKDEDNLLGQSKLQSIGRGGAFPKRDTMPAILHHLAFNRKQLIDKPKLMTARSPFS